MKSLEKFFSFFRYLLWIVFAFIVINLFVGIIKYKSIGSYIEFLNTRERSDVNNLLSFQHPNSIFSIFWEQTISTGDVLSLSGDIQIMSGAVLSGEMLSGTVEELSGDDTIIDPYDPAFQEEFLESFSGNTLSSDEDVSDEDTTSFGFTTNTGNVPSSNKGGSDILKYIEQQTAQ